MVHDSVLPPALGDDAQSLCNVPDTCKVDGPDLYDDGDACMHFQPDWDINPESSSSGLQEDVLDGSCINQQVPGVTMKAVGQTASKSFSSSPSSSEGSRSCKPTQSKLLAKTKRTNTFPTHGRSRPKSPSSASGKDALPKTKTPARAKSSRTPVAKRRAKTAEVDDEDPDVEEERLLDTMRMLILADEELYLRVLRYEVLIHRFSRRSES